MSAGAALAAVTALFGSTAGAVQRMFPLHTQRGQMTFVTAVKVILDGQNAQLGPGTRIHDAQFNRLVFAANLAGQTYTVNFVTDGTGTIREIWILTPEEIAQPLPPSP